MSRFQRATKTAIKLRAAAFGPAGSGKTFTALRVARGLIGDAGRLAVIDTEARSASRYANRFAFDVDELTDPTVDDYVAAIDDAAAAGYDALVIDSMSHAWKWLNDEIEAIAKARYRGNTWSAWAEGNAIWARLTKAILRFNMTGHVLATMQSKTEWVTVDNGSGRKAPQRVGLAPTAGKGIEYEFDLLLEMTPEHAANVIKDRTGKFQDRIIQKPDEAFGRELAAWLADGAPPVPSPSPSRDPGPAAATVDVAATLASIATAKPAALEKLAAKIRARLEAGELEPADAQTLLAAIDARTGATA